jgi:hypothetical protein
MSEKDMATLSHGMARATITSAPHNGDLPFAKELFEAADRMRGSVESAEYKHLVLGLLFLKYISDSFERRRAWLEQATHDPENADYFIEDDAERGEILEDRDEYISENVFWVPEQARWDALLAAASQVDIGERIDKALDAIERDNAEQREATARSPRPLRDKRGRHRDQAVEDDPASLDAVDCDHPRRHVPARVKPEAAEDAVLDVYPT